MPDDPPSDPYDPYHDQEWKPGSHLFPKRPHPKQGTRKRDKWGFCRHCNHGTHLKCNRCEHWCCQNCAKLRKKKGTVGVYILHCYPRCVLRRTFTVTVGSKSDLAEVASELTRATLNGAPLPYLGGLGRAILDSFKGGK